MEQISPEQFAAHMGEDKTFQDEQRKFNADMAGFRAETEGSLAAIHETLKTIPDAEQTAKIVEEVITKLLLSKGKLAFNLTVGAGTLAVAVIAILGGFKAFLGWIGFSYIGNKL